MASTTAAPETGVECLTRQNIEAEALTTRQAELAARRTALDADLIEAGKADDTAAIATIRADIARVTTDQATNAQDIDLKQHAIAATEKRIKDEKRLAAVTKAKGLVAAADPLAANLDKSMYTMIEDAVKLAANRAATGAALAGYTDDQIAHASVSSMLTTYDAIVYHLKSGLGLQVDAHGMRGDATIQQTAVKEFASKL